FGDAVTAVGPAEGLKPVERMMGNSTDALNYTQLIPIFVGLWLGVIVGSIPLALPGLHTSIRIGLAGGPMIVAIILSRLSTLGGLTAGAMTSSPTLMFANESTRSNQPAVAYAAVYPLSMLVPVFCAQLLVMILGL